MRASLRFAVLNRDGFTCRYCGKTANDRELHVDHVVPRAAGGSSEIENLVTACIKCNSGKSSAPLVAAMQKGSFSRPFFAGLYVIWWGFDGELRGGYIMRESRSHVIVDFRSWQGPNTGPAFLVPVAEIRKGRFQDGYASFQTMMEDEIEEARMDEIFEANAYVRACEDAIAEVALIFGKQDPQSMTANEKRCFEDEREAAMDFVSTALEEAKRKRELLDHHLFYPSRRPRESQ